MKHLSSCQGKLFSEEEMTRRNKPKPGETNSRIDQYPAIAHRVQSTLDQIRAEGADRYVISGRGGEPLLAPQQ
ncbi:hypothetical protein [Aureliella helgolandensis]|uniref:Uncharacterized protein n=1 Tax=Aureliella helgolandensis TaxID=2527968 RepID=A0A518G888_9BACT|nr:hypothetical protein [Aureliella helgolandensis]QDV24796.1 hypothetical protein Q31a_31180 [Aureliella helgolandensis]